MKGAGLRYVGGRREWLKVKHRDTVEAIVGGVLGTLRHPEVVIGRYTEPRRLVVLPSARRGTLPRDHTRTVSSVTSYTQIAQGPCGLAEVRRPYRALICRQNNTRRNPRAHQLGACVLLSSSPAFVRGLAAHACGPADLCPGCAVLARLAHRVV
ncbi:hypothetical protein [Kribbella sp. NBC_00359]|uniref:hypothetical protein n=1 Tax=Kribbella sp. NBC_00359 TaxID=2975966 RepID=UPI002E24A292